MNKKYIIDNIYNKILRPFYPIDKLLALARDLEVDEEISLGYINEILHIIGEHIENDNPDYVIDFLYNISGNIIKDYFNQQSFQCNLSIARYSNKTMQNIDILDFLYTFSVICNSFNMLIDDMSFEEIKDYILSIQNYNKSKYLFNIKDFSKVKDHKSLCDFLIKKLIYLKEEQHNLFEVK